MRTSFLIWSDVSGEIPGGLGSRCPNPISFKIKFWGPNSKLTGKDKCGILLKIFDIIDFFERSCDGLKFEFSLLLDLINLESNYGTGLGVSGMILKLPISLEI